MLHGLGVVADSDWALLDEGRSLLPSCISPELNDCLNNGNLAAYPNCERLLQIFDTNNVTYAGMESYVEATPFCPERGQHSLTLMWPSGLGTMLAGVFVAGIAAGFMWVKARKGRS